MFLFDFSEVFGDFAFFDVHDLFVLGGEEELLPLALLEIFFSML